MPILDWLDRKKDVKATEGVPYRLLESVTDLSCEEPDSQNMLIQGDNPEALKALLPYYAGQVKCLFGKISIAAVDGDEYSFSFDPEQYPANLLYQGAIKFTKHYYPRIGQMNGEETECAQALDRNPLVKFWARNIERHPEHSFWLPTSSDKFYPDFVAQLTDGRLLVVEYKGAFLKNDDTAEKENVGRLWAQKSGNLFLMAFKEDGSGRDMYHQLNRLLQK